ncbi:MAG: hypothetical protein KH436_05055 [Firmicutes bacterium]|jgi:hypothetical protein|nr:hypothetical protein [Bacillota bacterium]
MSESKKGVFNLFSYIALILAALLLVVYNLLPLVGVNVGGTFFGVLAMIKDVLMVIVVGYFAYYFAYSTKGKAWKIIFWIALVLYIAGVILGLF